METMLSLFKDLSVFDPDVIPDQLLFREKEIEELVRLFAPLQFGFKPASNVVIYGQPSVGKTSVARKVLKIFQEEEASKVATCYVNLAVKRTSAEVAAEIYFQVTTHLSRRRVSKCIEATFNKLQKNEKNLLIVFDDFNAFSGGDINTLLQTLLRPAESRFQGVHVRIILVSSGDDYFIKNRVRSSLEPVEFEFRDYDDDQKFEILKKRCIQGFSRFVISDKLIREVAERATDLRHALAILYYTGGIAHKKITKKEIDTAFSMVKGTPRMNESHLSELETFLLSKIKESTTTISTGELLREYKKKKGNITIQGIGKCLKKLKTLGIIDYRFVTGRGRTRVWFETYV